MNRIHFASSGRWAPCRASKRPCPLEHHIDGLTVGEMALVPEAFLGQLFPASFGPPAVDSDYIRIWQDERGNAHRDFDLPAIVHGDGTEAWYRHGVPYRSGDRPSVVTGAGDQIWFEPGGRHRATGPAFIGADGRIEYWLAGRKVTPWNFLLQTPARGKRAERQVQYAAELAYQYA